MGRYLEQEVEGLGKAYAKLVEGNLTVVCDLTPPDVCNLLKRGKKFPITPLEKYPDMDWIHHAQHPFRMIHPHYGSTT